MRERGLLGLERGRLRGPQLQPLYVEEELSEKMEPASLLRYKVGEQAVVTN